MGNTHDIHDTCVKIKEINKNGGEDILYVTCVKIKEINKNGGEDILGSASYSPTKDQVRKQTNYIL